MAKSTAAAAKPVAAKPATADPVAKAKPEKKGKVDYPGLVFNEDGRVDKKLESLPEDFNPKAHKPLKRMYFATDALFMKWNAKQLREKADRLDRQAERLEKLGSKQQAGKAKRLLAMQERVAAIKKELESEGLNVDELLAELS